ncbi:MAG TPA: hypothetical protein DDW46_06945, partial [Dehalococcoidia bacterium]|nr:hypothetical protein [Dehalococcoidia bacterium]
DENFSIYKTQESDWVVVDSDGMLEGPANLQVMDYLLQSVQVLPAAGFEDDLAAKSLDFDAPDGSVRINTSEESNSPTTRLKLIKKDDESYYVKTPTQSTVFLIQYILGDFLLMKKSDILVSD